MTKAVSEAVRVEGELGTGEVTGRFAIDAERRAPTVVPPTTPEAEEISLDAVIEAAPAATKPATLPPPVPPQARTHTSGHAPSRSRAPAAAAPADESPMDSLRPFYKELEGAPERAQVDIADLSLQQDNPYLASSLVPPAETPPATGRIVVGIAALVAFAAGGYFAFVRGPAEPVEPPVVAAVAVVEPAVEPTSAPVKRLLPPGAAAAQVETKPAPLVAAAEPAQAAAAPVQAAASAPAVEPVGEPNLETPAPVASDALPPTAVEVGAQLPTAVPAAAPAVGAEAPVTSALAAPANLPETPTREEVAAGFDALRPELLQCAAGKTGVVVIDATLASTGRVAYALVDGTTFKGTPEGSCMARAIRKARFPQFAQAALKVRYPVQL